MRGRWCSRCPTGARRFRPTGCATRPGQFLTLRVPSDRTGSVARCYSLCSSPFTDDALTVTVKRTDDGYASNWLCDHAHPGMRIHVLAPSGTFVPKTLDDRLPAAGRWQRHHADDVDLQVRAVRGQRPGVLIYANRDENSVIFADALRELSAKYPDRLTVRALAGIGAGAAERGRAGQTGRPVSPAGRRSSAGRGRSWRPPRRRSKTLNVPATASPHRGVQVAGVRPVRGGRSIEDEPTATRPPATAVVTLDGETHKVRWPRSAKLLDVLLDKGLDAPFSCREGHCGACAVLTKSGEVEHGGQRRARAVRISTRG